MVKKQWTAGAVLGLVLLLLSLPAIARSQVQDPWKGPLRLSSEGGSAASEAFMVADDYGYLHVFWHEVDGDDRQYTIQYRRYDGLVWSRPVDIYVAPAGATIGYLAPAMDKHGTVYLLWTEGNSGPVFLASAPAHSALSAQAWTQPQSLDIAAYRLRLQIDTNGVFHILYSEFYGLQPGVYYTRSDDTGLTWSDSQWLDPDIPVGQAPSALNFVADAKNGLHALWHYVALDVPATPGTWVRYAHSLDAGDSWSAPFTVDATDDEPDELRLPYPGLAVSGDDVHVVWAGDSLTHREHRFSEDRGRTWSTTRRILGDLHGQAIGDQLIVDTLGRIHHLAQVRWPAAIWHTVWDGSSWKGPAVAYLIARTDADNKSPRENDRIHAHNVRAALLRDHKLVVSFTNSPEDSAPLTLYTIHRTLTDLPANAPLPTPALPAVDGTATPSPPRDVATATPTPGLPLAETSPPPAPTQAQNAIFLGAVPSLLLAAVVITVHSYRKQRRRK